MHSDKQQYKLEIQSTLKERRHYVGGKRKNCQIFSRIPLITVEPRWGAHKTITEGFCWSLGAAVSKTGIITI